MNLNTNLNRKLTPVDYRHAYSMGVMIDNDRTSYARRTFSGHAPGTLTDHEVALACNKGEELFLGYAMLSRNPDGWFQLAIYTD